MPQEKNTPPPSDSPESTIQNVEAAPQTTTATADPQENNTSTPQQPATGTR
jgi:hypothetical protein